MIPAFGALFNTTYPTLVPNAFVSDPICPVFQLLGLQFLPVTLLVYLYVSKSLC